VRKTAGAYDFRVIPGLAYNPSAGDLAAHYFEGLASSSRIRLQAKYEAYTEDYTNLYTPQFVLGEVSERLGLNGTLDLSRNIRLSGEWIRSAGDDDGGETAPTDRSGSVSLLLHRKSWPAWDVSFQEFKTRAATETTTRSFVQNRLEYHLPEAWSRRALLRRLNAEAFLRLGHTSVASSSGLARQDFSQGFIRVNAGFTDLFHGSAFYRRSDLDDASGGHTGQIARSERVLFSLSHEDWRPIQVNIRVENTLDQDFHRVPGIKDTEVDRYSQVNLRLRPGHLWQRLSPLIFEFNINQTLNGSASTGASVRSWLWKFCNRSNEEFDKSASAHTYYVQNEFRPTANFYAYTLLEWGGQELRSGLSTLDSREWRFSEKLDIKPGLRTRLNLQYKQYFRDSGYGRIVRHYEPSAWVEYRWTGDLQNTANLRYRRTYDDDADIRDVVDDLEARCDLTWRKRDIIGLRRFEARQSFSGTSSRSRGHTPRRDYALGSTTSLDLYPLHSLIVRAQFDFSKYWDRRNPNNDYHEVVFDLKILLRF
jgi:hypothetical protein